MSKERKDTYLRVHLFILLRRMEELLSPVSAPAAWIMGHRFRTGTPALSNFLPSNLPPRISIFHLPEQMIASTERSRNPRIEGSRRLLLLLYKAGTKSVRERREKFCNRVELITRTEHRCGNKPFSRAHVSIQEEL